MAIKSPGSVAKAGKMADELKRASKRNPVSRTAKPVKNPRGGSDTFKRYQVYDSFGKEVWGGWLWSYDLANERKNLPEGYTLKVKALTPEDRKMLPGAKNQRAKRNPSSGAKQRARGTRSFAERQDTGGLHFLEDAAYHREMIKKAKKTPGKYESPKRMKTAHSRVLELSRGNSEWNKPRNLYLPNPAPKPEIFIRYVWGDYQVVAVPRDMEASQPGRQVVLGHFKTKGEASKFAAEMVAKHSLMKAKRNPSSGAKQRTKDTREYKHPGECTRLEAVTNYLDAAAVSRTDAKKHGTKSKLGQYDKRDHAKFLAYSKAEGAGSQIPNPAKVKPPFKFSAMPIHGEGKAFSVTHNNRFLGSVRKSKFRGAQWTFWDKDDQMISIAPSRLKAGWALYGRITGRPIPA